MIFTLSTLKSNSLRVGIQNINVLAGEKNIKSLAFALLLKDTFVSSTIKNYNPYSLQKKLKEKGFDFHHSTIVKYVNNLRRLGFITEENNNLTVKKLYAKEKAYIIVKKHKAKEFKHYIHFIRFAILKRKVKQAEYVYSKKMFIVKKLDNPENRKEYIRAKRLAKKYDILRVDETGFKYRQSIRSLAKLFNCSISEIYTTIKFLIASGKIHVEKFIKKLGVFFGNDQISENLFVWKGYLYEVECNSYKIISS